MTTLRQLFYGLALVAALCLLIRSQQQRITTAEARADVATERLQTMEQRNTRQANAIIRMGNELAAQRAAQQGQQTAQADVRRQHAASHLQKPEIRRNDPSFDSWGAQPLPGAARRLHERPALAGASGYRAWLSRRNALQPAAGSAAK